MSELDKKTAEKIDLYARVILCSEAPSTYRAAIRDLVRIYVGWMDNSPLEAGKARMGFLTELLYRHGFDQTVVEIPVNAETAWELARRLVAVEKENRAADAGEGK